MKLHEQRSEWYQAASADFGGAPACVGYGVLTRPKYKGAVAKTVVHHTSQAYPGNDTVLFVEYLDDKDRLILNVHKPELYDYWGDGSVTPHRPPEQIPLIGDVEHWDSDGNLFSTERDYLWKAVPPCAEKEESQP